MLNADPDQPKDSRGKAQDPRGGELRAPEQRQREAGPLRLERRALPRQLLCRRLPEETGKNT